MKRTLLLLIQLILPVVLLISCKEENLINAGSRPNANNPNTPGTTTNPSTPNSTTKCYLKSISGKEDFGNYSSSFSYNAKNLLEKEEGDGQTTLCVYDASNRISKITHTDGNAVEIFSYEYDSKGNITKAKYTSTDALLDLPFQEFIYTTNSKGQVEKVTAVTSDEKIEFNLEYDAKSNLKKIILNADKKETILENVSFDDKSNIYANTGLSKVNIPIIIIGSVFGENLSYFLNTNNILSDKTLSVFSTNTTTYKYEYTKDGFPSKMSYIRKVDTDTEKGEEAYSYDCK